MVSVIMSTFKEPLEYIKLSVESVLLQTYEQLELIIIVDDPSNNELIKMLKDYQKQDNRVRCLVNDKNMGLVGSLNRAIKYVRGNYVARMDADDISFPDRIKHQIEYLETNKLDLVGGNIQDIDKSGNATSAITRYPEFNRDIIKKARFSSPLAHPTWLGKRKVFEQLNGYHEIDACEDYDFLIRAILHGNKLGNLQETILQYRINPNSISSTKKARQKAALYLLRKNYRSARETTEEEYVRFIKSEAGKRKIHQLDSYYNKSSQLKKMSGSKMKQCLYGLYIFASSNEGRSVVFNAIMEKILIK